MPRLAHQDPSEGKALHEALRDVSPVEAEEFKKNVLSPAEIERRKNRKATPTLSRPEVPMSDTALRASLIRLAYQNPNLRADILPLVAKEAGSYQEYVDRKRKKGEKPMTEDAWRSRTQGGGKSESKGEEKSGQPPAGKKPAKSFKGNYRPKMESVMTTYKLTDDDAAQVIQFSIDRPKRGTPKTDAQLKQDFLANASPETKARMENMTAADFKIMLRAVLDQEEGGGKQASLRTAAIRFAHENPALRKHVLAAIKEADEGSPEADKAELKADADPASKDQNLASTWEKVGGSKTAADFSPERGEVEGVRDDLIAALKKKGIRAEDAVSSNALYIGEDKYAIHGPWLEGEGLGDRGEWIQKPTRAAWLAEAVKVLAGLAKK